MAKIYQYKRSLPQNPSSSGFTSTTQDAGDDGYSSHNFSSSDYEKEVELEVEVGRGDYSGLEYTGSMRVQDNRINEMVKQKEMEARRDQFLEEVEDGASSEVEDEKEYEEEEVEKGEDEADEEADQEGANEEEEGVFEEEEEENEGPMDLSGTSRHVQSFTISSTADLREPGGALWQRRESRDSGNSSPVSGHSSPPVGPQAPKRPHRMTKDEKKAREMGIDMFIQVQEIITLEMTELRDKLKDLVNLGMSEDQVKEAMSIRKRGKNKHAAQKGRKKKENEIDGLKRQFEEKTMTKRTIRQEEARALEEKKQWELKLLELKLMVIQHENKDPNIYELVVINDEVQLRRRSQQGEKQLQELERWRKEGLGRCAT